MSPETNSKVPRLHFSTLKMIYTLAKEPDFPELAKEIRYELRKPISSGDADLIHSFDPGEEVFTPDISGASHLLQRLDDAAGSDTDGA